MSIPLVQEATKDAINTSIIAIKRNIERINMLLGLSNSEEIDTSEFVKKSDIVDEVTVGNMQSVSSNAVAVALRYLETEHFTGKYWINGKKIYSITRQVDIKSGNYMYNHNVSNIEFITDIKAISPDKNNNTFRALNFSYYAEDNWGCDVCVNKEKIIMECGTAFANDHRTSYVTWEYTKTTD